MWPLRRAPKRASAPPSEYVALDGEDARRGGHGRRHDLDRELLRRPRAAALERRRAQAGGVAAGGQLRPPRGRADRCRCAGGRAAASRRAARRPRAPGRPAPARAAAGRRSGSGSSASRRERSRSATRRTPRAAPPRTRSRRSAPARARRAQPRARRRGRGNGARKEIRCGRRRPQPLHGFVRHAASSSGRVVAHRDPLAARLGRPQQSLHHVEHVQREGARRAVRATLAQRHARVDDAVAAADLAAHEAGSSAPLAAGVGELDGADVAVGIRQPERARRSRRPRSAAAACDGRRRRTGPSPALPRRT